MSEIMLWQFKAYLMQPISWILGTIGLLLGSFYNVCIYRIPRESFWDSRRSHCPGCGALIPSWHNIPIFSYLWLRGRAHCCKMRISLRYPLVEFLTGLSLCLIYWKFSFLSDFPLIRVVDFNNLLRFLHAFSFTSLLLICSFIDIDHKIIPDVISIPMILLTPLIIWLHPELDWKSGLIGVLLGGGSVILINRIYYLLRGETGIGMGDAKLLAAIGGWLGYQAIFPTFFYGSILGSLFGVSAMILKKRLNLKSEIPFGPFLAVGALLHMFLSRQVQELFFYF
ncbi:MAG: A24 family peptidase [Oligoflexales bacterium]